MSSSVSSINTHKCSTQHHSLSTSGSLSSSQSCCTPLKRNKKPPPAPAAMLFPAVVGMRSMCLQTKPQTPPPAAAAVVVVVSMRMRVVTPMVVVVWQLWQALRWGIGKWIVNKKRKTCCVWSTSLWIGALHMLCNAQLVVCMVVHVHGCSCMYICACVRVSAHACTQATCMYVCMCTHTTTNTYTQGTAIGGHHIHAQ